MRVICVTLATIKSVWNPLSFQGRRCRTNNPDWSNNSCFFLLQVFETLELPKNPLTQSDLSSTLTSLNEKSAAQICIRQICVFILDPVKNYSRAGATFDWGNTLLLAKTGEVWLHVCLEWACRNLSTRVQTNSQMHFLRNYMNVKTWSQKEHCPFYKERAFEV